jgi:hypothetical protein
VASDYLTGAAEYNATTGALISTQLITPTNIEIFEIAVSGNNLFGVSEDRFGNSEFARYNATTGTLINPNFIALHG